MPDDSNGRKLAETTADRWRLGFALASATLLGMAAIAAAVSVNALAPRYLVAIIVALAGLVTLPLLGSRQRVHEVLVAVFALGLSVGFSISFMHRTLLPGRYVPFMSGAQAITVSLTLVAVAMYLAVWMFERGFYGMRRPVRACGLLVWPQVIFMAVGVLSLGNAMDAHLALLEEFRLLCLLVVTLVVMNFKPREVDIYLWVLGASVMLQAGLAATQFVTGGTLGLGVLGEAAPIVAGVDFERVARPTGTIGDPNILAYFFEITAPLMLALLFVARGRLEQAFFLIATAAGVLGTIVTLSRAAWIGLPLTFGFVAIAVYGRRLLSLRAAVVGMAMVLASVAIASSFSSLIIRRLFGDDAGSTAARMPLNRAAMLVIEQFPVLGVGLNNFAVSFTTYDPTGFSRVLTGVDYVVHNLFLLVWTEVGTIGFVAFLWVFGSVFLAAYRLRGADPRSRAITLAVAAGFGAHMLHGMVDPGFKLNLTISQLISAQIGIVGWLMLDARRRNIGAAMRAS